MSAVSQDEPWVGRTFDLIGAYRQCAVKPTSKQYAYIIVQQPDTLELVGFRMTALPFGSVWSVHGFLRIAHRLWYVLVKEFKVLLTNHFDDFVAASPTSECSSIISCVHMYFNKLLGWAFSESGDKVPPFSAMFQALGVNIDVSTLVTRRTGAKSWLSFWIWFFQGDTCLSKMLFDFGGGFSSLQEMFSEGWQSVHWQPSHTMLTLPQAANSRTMQSWPFGYTGTC